MELRLMRDFAKCLVHNQHSPDHEALIEIVNRLDSLHPSPETTTLITEGITRAYRLGMVDAA